MYRVSARDRRGHRGVPARPLRARPRAGGASGGRAPRGWPTSSSTGPSRAAGATGSSAPTRAIRVVGRPPERRGAGRGAQGRGGEDGRRGRDRGRAGRARDDGDPRRHLRPAAHGTRRAREGGAREAADRRARDLGGGASRAPRGRRGSRDAPEAGAGGFPGARASGSTRIRSRSTRCAEGSARTRSSSSEPTRRPTFSRWKEPEEVLKWVKLAVGTRGGYPMPDLSSLRRPRRPVRARVARGLVERGARARRRRRDD